VSNASESKVSRPECRVNAKSGEASYPRPFSAGFITNTVEFAQQFKGEHTLVAEKQFPPAPVRRTGE